MTGTTDGSTDGTTDGTVDGAAGDEGRALPGHLRSIQPTSQFAGDDGSADPELARLLRAHVDGPGDAGSLRLVVRRLAATRVLVPVLAELAVADVVQHETAAGTSSTSKELHVDKEAAAGVVAIEAPDGRRALPVFTSVDAMRAWRSDARPVPVEAPRAALSAVSEGWSLLVVDPAGPATVLVPRPAVWALAKGQDWHPALVAAPEGSAAQVQVDPGVASAVADAAAPVQHVVRAHAEPGRRAEVAVVLALDPGLDRAGLDRVLSQVNARLGASTLISERVDSLELRVGAAR